MGREQKLKFFRIVLKQNKWGHVFKRFTNSGKAVVIGMLGESTILNPVRFTNEPIRSLFIHDRHLMKFQ